MPGLAAADRARRGPIQVENPLAGPMPDTSLRTDGPGPLPLPEDALARDVVVSMPLSAVGRVSDRTGSHSPFLHRYP